MKTAIRFVATFVAVVLLAGLSMPASAQETPTIDKAERVAPASLGFKVGFLGDHTKGNPNRYPSPMYIDLKSNMVSIYERIRDGCRATNIPIKWSYDGKTLSIEDIVKTDDNLTCRFRAKMSVEADGYRGRYGLGGSPESLREGDIVPKP